MTTTSVARKFLAIMIIEPTPRSAATSSAATSVPQHTPTGGAQAGEDLRQGVGQDDVAQHLKARRPSE